MSHGIREGVWMAFFEMKDMKVTAVKERNRVFYATVQVGKNEFMTFRYFSMDQPMGRVECLTRAPDFSIDENGMYIENLVCHAARVGFAAVKKFKEIQKSV